MSKCVHGRDNPAECVYCQRKPGPFKAFELYVCVPIIVDADTESDARSLASGLVNTLASAQIDDGRGPNANPIVRVGAPQIHRVSELSWDEVAVPDC